ncbi:hypothetical protein ACRALDRAFT_2090380, partial [Sodiomyces alcalophilus JCM 7366]|uniref:uncharacterized protein n=1 Tax=Sodiomyces alcalophilus JCM 7366 TaxID=591952 RepID=UPI0039B63E9E
DTPEQPYALHLIQADHIPQDLLDSHLISSLPDHLSPERPLHVIVSTKAGTGLASMCWETIVQPLLGLLFSSIPPRREDGKGDGERYHVLTTRSAQSIRQFAQSHWARRQNTTSHPETIILLSGDGGITDLLNGRDDADDDGTSSSPNGPLPTIAILPLGTGNALFHSLHKPLYDGVSGDADGATAATTRPTVPSPLVLGLRTLFRGCSAPLPSFEVCFSPGSKLVSSEEGAGENTNRRDDERGFSSQHRHDNSVSRLIGAVVASYGFHAQLVWESDTPDYRRHGDKRFAMVAAELLRESHAYDARVHIYPTSLSSSAREIDMPTHQDTTTTDVAAPRPRFSYVLATLVSNLERTFTISPAARPLHPALHLVYFGPVGGQRTMEIMKAAYDGGKHVALPDVGYEEVAALRVTLLEADARWRKVCVDGTIVEIPHGGDMTV